MKKILLFFIILYVSVISCNEEDANIQDDISTKELVKNALIEFNKSAVKTGKYKDYLHRKNENKEDHNLAPEELERLVQDFLGDQTPEFIEAYNKLVDLKITSEEFKLISSEFDYMRIQFQVDTKGLQCCSGNPRATLLDSFFDFICGCDDSDNEDEDEE